MSDDVPQPGSLSFPPPPSANDLPVSESAASEPTTDPQRRPLGRWFIPVVLVSSLLLYSASVLLILRLSSKLDTPTALIAVRGTPELASAEVRAVGDHQSISGAFDPAEDYLCRLHVMPGLYRIEIVDKGTIMAVHDGFITEFDVDPYRPLFIGLPRDKSPAKPHPTPATR